MCQVAAPIAETIPTSMRADARWICAETRRKPDGRLDKIPCDAVDGWTCNALDASNWGTFDQALASMKRYKLAGIGFVLDDDSGWAAVDLDHCVTTDGTLEPWAREIVEALDSYTEYSVSGTGVHIFVRGGLPRSGAKSGHVEMYCGGRFIFVTGNHVAGTPGEVEERDAELRDIYMEHCRQAERAGSLTEESLDIPEDEPPVHLHDVDRALWDGKRFSKHTDGTLHRSSTLYAIGLMLARYGCTRRVIAQSVQDRDAALGLHKYDDRRDDREYRRIAVRTWTQARQEHRVYGKTMVERELLAENALLKEQLETMEREMAERDRAHSLAMRAIKGAGVTDPKERIPAGERLTEVAAVWACERAEMAGKTDGDGFARVYLRDIADTAGCAVDTASRHLKKAEERGLIERRTLCNDSSGKTELYIRLKAPPEETLQSIAAQRQEERERRPRVKTCPNHPDALIVKRWTLACSECGEIFESGEERIDPNAESAEYVRSEVELDGEPSTFCRAINTAEGTNHRQKVDGPVPHPFPALNVWPVL